MGGEIARMNMKKWTALFAALALALCVLAGCGGSRALTSVLLDLLEGQYKNVSVETDPELERALRRAAADGGDTADILARLKNELNLTGGSLTLSRLGDGQQGEHAVELRFEPGSDPDAAARRVFVTWNGVFGGLPRDGQYAAAIAMIEAENGYYIAVDVNVVKAGAQHDDSDDEPEEEPDDGFVKVGTLEKLQEALESSGETPPKIRLTNNITISDTNWSGFSAFSGELDGNNQTVTIQGGSQGLFAHIAQGGSVKNLKVEVTGAISSSGNVGAVAGINKGEITNCHVTIERDGCISASGSDGFSYAGGVVGLNNYNGSVSDCTVTVNGSVSAGDGSYGYAGGVAGQNLNSSVSDCTVTVNGSITASGEQDYAYAGGVAGGNSFGSSITGCTVKIASGSISASDSLFSYAGSVVGYNNGTVDDYTVEDSNDPKLPEIGN